MHIILLKVYLNVSMGFDGLENGLCRQKGEIGFFRARKGFFSLCLGYKPFKQNIYKQNAINAQYNKNRGLLS